MSLALFSYPNDIRVVKILVAANYSGVYINVPVVPFPEATESAEWKSKNPLNLFPWLDTPHGAIFQTNAILRYISSIGKGNIYGETPFDQAEVDFWIDWSKEFELPTSVFLYSLWGLEEGNKAHKGFASKDLQYLLGKLNEVLLTRTFLVGNGVTLADIAVAFSLYDLFTQIPDFKFFSAWKNAVRWFKTVVNQPHAKAVIGPTKIPSVGEEDLIGCFKLKLDGEVLAQPRSLVPPAYLKEPEVITELSLTLPPGGPHVQEKPPVLPILESTTTTTTTVGPQEGEKQGEGEVAAVETEGAPREEHQAHLHPAGGEGGEGGKAGEAQGGQGGWQGVHVEHEKSENKRTKSFGFLGLGGDGDKEKGEKPVVARKPSLRPKILSKPQLPTKTEDPEKGDKLRRLEKLFQRADIDGNGTLDTQELQFLIISAFRMKENDVHFSSGALSKYAELQLRNYAGEESAGVGFEGFVKLYDAILADPEIPNEIKSSAKSAEEDYKKEKKARSFFGRKKESGHPEAGQTPGDLLGSKEQTDYFKGFGDLFDMTSPRSAEKAKSGSSTPGVGGLLNLRKPAPPSGTAPPPRPHVDTPPPRPPPPKEGEHQPPPPPPKKNQPSHMVSSNPLEDATKLTFTIKAGGPSSSGWGKMLSKGEKTWVTLETKTNGTFTQAHLDDFVKHYHAKPTASTKKNTVYLELQTPEEVESLCATKTVTLYVKF